MKGSLPSNITHRLHNKTFDIGHPLLIHVPGDPQWIRTILLEDAVPPIEASLDGHLTCSRSNWYVSPFTCAAASKT